MANIKLTSIEGNGQWLDGGSMFGNAPRAIWQKWLAPDEFGRIPLACRSLLLEIDDKKILLEVGIGAFFEPKLASRFGVQNPEEHLLLKNLAALGIAENDIDYIILSHLHFDHAGGLLPTHKEIEAGDDRLLFPNAKILVGKQAWQRALTPHFRDRASFLPQLNEKLQSSDRLIQVEGPKLAGFFEEHISFFTSDGHTPGQMHTIIKGEFEKIIFAGDLVPGIPWVHLPITMGFDRFAEQVIDEKQQLYANYADTDTWLFYTHDPKTACSKVVKTNKGRFEPSEGMENLDSYQL